MKFFRPLAAAAVAAAFLLAGCASGGSGGATAGGGATLKIGLVNPTTGASSWAGVPIAQGAQTAVDEINETGFLGDQKLELTSKDSEGDPATAISAYRGFASDDYLAAICCTLSSEAGSFAQLAASLKFPTVANGATLKGLNAPPYMYRTIVLPADPGGMYAQTAQAIAAKGNVKTAVIVETADNEGNVSDAKVWQDNLQKDGITVLQVIDTFQADTDFTVPVTTILSQNPDLVVFSTQGPNSATMIKMLRERGYKGLTTSSYGIAVPSVWKVGGEALAGTIFPIPFSPDGTSDRTKDFVQRYQQQWNSQPDLYAAQGYNAVWFIAEGIKAAGANVTRQSLADALSKLDSFELASGNVVKMVDGQAELSDAVLIAQWNADGTQSLWK